MAETESLNCLIGLDFDLLKTNLNAFFQKGEKGVRLLVTPTSLNATESVTLSEMLNDFKSALGIEDAQAITGSITALGESSKDKKSIDPGKLMFQLSQAFIYVDQTVTPSITEYALAIKVDATEALPDMGFFRIKSLSIAVWNTRRQTVLDRMNMGDFYKLLPA